MYCGHIEIQDGDKGLSRQGIDLGLALPVSTIM
jgi:hypothetical protein